MKVGLITYHSAYNFGSTLQAVALQNAIEKLGYNCEIINYRMKEQKRYYSKYRIHYGIKTFIKDVLQLPNDKKRRLRETGYEAFMKSFMNLTEEVEEPSQVYDLWNRYPILISGSDQIWNKHSNELHNNDWEHMEPYLLHGFNGKKISYASSVGNMTDNDEIIKLVSYIKNFDFVSFREQKIAEKFSEIMNKKIQTVLDPTFLICKDEWENLLGLKKAQKEKFILYYSLDGIKGYNQKIRTLKRIADNTGLKIIVVTPLANAPFKDHSLELHPEYSTLDFMNSIYNAEWILTDSYHGTILSINLEKNVYSICREGVVSDNRKTDILNRLGMENRIINSLEEFIEKRETIDYNLVRDELCRLRNESWQYLKNAINYND